MKKAARILLPILFLLPIFFSVANADELLDVQKKIDSKKREYSSTISSLNQIKKDITSLSSSVGSTQIQAEEANTQVEKIRKDLEVVEEDLGKKKDQLSLVLSIRDTQVQYLYKYPGNSPLELFLTSDGFSRFSQNLGIQNKVIGTSKELIEGINAEISVIEQSRNEIAAAKKDLEQISSQINSQLAYLQGQLSYQSNQQNTLSSQMVQIQGSLSKLTQKQKQLIAAKLAASAKRQTIGDQVPASIPLPNPGFSPAYAFATYGYPHRVGMNQYGAYGRALVGQSYINILKSYYTGVAVGAYSVPSRINVVGWGSIPFEDNYLRGISEMPRSWPMEALKSQAVAARTYALNWIQTHPGQSICTTQSCQVYNGSAANCSPPYNNRWCAAVNATRGVVITYAGSPITAWYASTSGGYTLSSQAVWGGYRPYALGKKDFSGSWPGGAYDKSSPWFHKPWGGRCSNGSFPWMTKEETTDIFDSLLLSKASSSYNQYLSPTDGCLGPKGWSHVRVVAELGSRGIKSIGDLKNIFIGYDGNGNTSSVTVVSSNYSAKTFSSGDFNSIYHLRSPGTRVILTTLFDVIIR